MKNKSFTLVETIVVITIFSIIAVGISSSFISGMKIWGRAREVNFVQSQVLFSLEQIAVKLRQCVNISEIGFSGGSEEFSFPGILGNNIGRIEYRFEASSKAIFLRFQRLDDILLAREKEEDITDVNYTERKLLSAKSFSVSYLSFIEEEGSYDWVSEWNEESGIFSAVKIEIGVGQDKFEKVIFVPIAEATVAEEQEAVSAEEEEETIEEE